MSEVGELSDIGPTPMRLDRGSLRAVWAEIRGFCPMTGKHGADALAVVEWRWGAGLAPFGGSRRSVGEVRLRVALVVLLVLGVAVAAASAMGVHSPSAARLAQGARTPALIVGQWRVRVMVKLSGLRGVRVAVDRLVPPKRPQFDFWIQHDVVFHNTGSHSVVIPHPADSVFIGDHGHRRLLAADEFCSYSQPENPPNAPVTERCMRGWRAWPRSSRAPTSLRGASSTCAQLGTERYVTGLFSSSPTRSRRRREGRHW